MVGCSTQCYALYKVTNLSKNNYIYKLSYKCSENPNQHGSGMSFYAHTHIAFDCTSFDIY